MPAPWNDWYHCNGNTHGTWLRGDLRGWRARHHREHAEGDYRNPPPAERDEWLRHNSQKLMKKPATKLSEAQAVFAGRAMVRRLIDAKIEVLSLALDDHHYHMVIRCPDHQPRRYVGLAKQRASFLLVRDWGLVAPVWAKRCLCKPIRDRAHQVRAVNYDIEHELHGAYYVWTIKDAVPEYTP